MTVSLKHAFQSQKSDSSDPTVVQPSNWNAEHTLTCATGKVLGRASSGTGTVEEIPCTATGRNIIAANTYSDVANQLGVQALVDAAFPAGMIMPFGSSSAPSGWIACDGSAVSRTTYSRLFAVLGTTWGAGNGSSTFNVPDLRGVFLRGVDNGKGYDGGRALGSYQADGYPSHTHTITDNGHTHTYTAGGSATGLVGSSGTLMGVNVSSPAGGSVTSSSKANLTIDSGGGSATEVRPKNVAVLYCIRA